MPNIASLLKAEITRLARKTVRESFTPLQSASASHRHQLASLKKQVQALEREVARLQKNLGRTTNDAPFDRRARLDLK